MAETISLMELMGEEYTYSQEDPECVILECMDIYESINTYICNIVTLEAAQEVKKTNKDLDGGTGPMPTNSKSPIDHTDKDGGMDEEIVVDFEDKILTEKKGLWKTIKILITKIKEFIESVIFKIVSTVRKDQQTLRNSSKRDKINLNIGMGKGSTYAFKTDPATTVHKLLQDIENCIDSILPQVYQQNYDANSYPFQGQTILGFSLSRADKSLGEKLSNYIYGTGKRSLLAAHVSIETLEYFVITAPIELKSVRNKWHDLEKHIPDFDSMKDKLSLIQSYVMNAQKAINTTLSITMKLIFHISSLISALSK